MKMKIRHQRELMLALQVAVILFGLLALGVSQTTVAARPLVILPQDQPTVESPVRTPSPQTSTESTDPSGGEMAPDPRPDIESWPCLVAAVSVPGAQENDRLREPWETGCGGEEYIGYARLTGCPLCATCLISTCLARQFTLVGAKPSGTS